MPENERPATPTIYSTQCSSVWRRVGESAGLEINYRERCTDQNPLAKLTFILGGGVTLLAQEHKVVPFS